MVKSTVIALLLARVPAGAQQPAPVARDSGSSTATAIAVRAASAPTIDGRDTDPSWRDAPPIDQFQVFVPTEGGTPRFRTVARVTYDDRNLYAVVRMYDPHPDSIVALLSRHDVRTASEQCKIVIDSYHDRRTGYEFAINPAGVKREYSIYNDIIEDESWDGIWDAAATVDSLGWVAEFRIPLSQLRFPRRQNHTFGFAVWRDVVRYNERYSWPLYRNSVRGFMSQLGDLNGIEGIATPKRLEVTPYVLGKNATEPLPPRYGRDNSLSMGADLKYGVASNLTLDVAANPDFGQVEADPAVLNLTAFEPFFLEKRPFFLEGAGIFRFDLVDCGTGGGVPCEGLFYSRRVGRDPELLALYGDASSPTSTTILGAAKLTGRTSRGLSVGLVDGVTQRELGVGRQTIEPLTNYAVARLQQDFRNGSTGVGVMFTGVNRAVDESSRDLLRRSAYGGGLDFRHRFLNESHEVAGYATASLVSGTASAITLTQTSPVHFYQRPDVGLGVDSTRTSLSGTAAKLAVGKVSGGVLRYGTSYQRISPGYEINDVGFLIQADQQVWNNSLGFAFNDPKGFYRNLFLTLFNEEHWTTSGLSTDRILDANVFTTLNNNWTVVAETKFSQLPGTFCSSRCTRGGPALRDSPQINLTTQITGDNRRAVIPGFFGIFIRDDYGRSKYVLANPSTEFRATSRFSMTLGPTFVHNIDDSQYYGADTLGAPIFAHLDQKLFSVLTRANFTATPTLSLQMYAEPFVTSGVYSNLRSLGDRGARDYDARFTPLADRALANNPGGFNFKQFRSTSVVRWEYRSGSTLFFVWTQNRDAFDAVADDFDVRSSIDALFRLHPRNTFLVKASYWLDL